MQQWWFDGGFGLKSVYLWCFMIFTSLFKVFINIHEYANKMIYISDIKKAGVSALIWYHC